MFSFRSGSAPHTHRQHLNQRGAGQGGKVHLQAKVPLGAQEHAWCGQNQDNLHIWRGKICNI